MSQSLRVSWRLWLIVAVMGLSGLGLVVRLVQVQIVDHSRYAAEARLTRTSEQAVNVRRGAILDRNGYPMAASVDTYDVMVERKAWEDAAVASADAQTLAAIANTPAEEMLARIANAEAFELAVTRDLNYNQAVQVRELGLRGVRLVDSSRRVYPEGSLAAQVIGFVGQDNIGLTGLEADLEELLSGKKGSLTFERDGLGQPIGIGDTEEVAARAGVDVVLTIDRYIQNLAEKELDAAIEKNEATGGTIIVMEPESGAILAMANRPSFDLTRPDLSDESKLALLRNRAVSDQYEPGSVFKLVTMAAALDEGLVGPWTEWYDSGVVNVSGWSIYNWDFSVNGTQSVTQILSKSLNTGAAWLSELLGEERFYDYVQRFGFGQLTGVELGGEVEGGVRTPASDPENWQPVDRATNSFGQGISVTPIQVTAALSAIANDGKMMRPYIVNEILTSARRERLEPQEVRQVITPESARTLKEMMGVVVEGIPTNLLDVQGYVVGGKTGTAQVVKGDGQYKEEAYISSFAGIAPLEDPAIAVLVKIDEPKAVPWGTVVAAPAFSHIVQTVLNYYKIPPTEDAFVQGTQ